jgi:L-ascorbate metabolism protein UlaG (beta-lactamase superfamily)
MKRFSIPFLSMIIVLTPAASPCGRQGDVESLSREKAHHRDGGFINPWLPEEKAGNLFRLLEWKFETNPYSEAKKNPPVFPVTRPDFDRILKAGDSVTYLGHATLWVRLQKQNIITDPVFGDIVYFIRRRTPLPVPPGELPPMQVVLISHSHYDHLDKDSIRELGNGPLYLTPLGYRDWFADVVPGARVVELDWFETFTHEGVQYRLLPAQHWAKRTPWDTNRRLWGSWLIESADRKVFFGGDSGYFHGFSEFGNKYGPIDAVLLPIAAYEPRWFMSTYHMDPDEAFRAFLELRGKVMIPQQWGVFDLTDEPLDMPPRDYRKAARDAGLGEERTPLLPHGGTWFFPGK